MEIFAAEVGEKKVSQRLSNLVEHLPFVLENTTYIRQVGIFLLIVRFYPIRLRAVQVLSIKDQYT